MNLVYKKMGSIFCVFFMCFLISACGGGSGGSGSSGSGDSSGAPKYTLYSDSSVKIASDANLPVTVTRVPNPSGQTIDGPIYQIDYDGDIDSVIDIKFNDINLTTGQYIIPLTFDTSSNKFIVDGSVASDGQTIILPHLSIWSYLFGNINNIYNNSVNYHFASDAIKGAYIGQQLQFSDYNTQLEALIKNLAKSFYNRIYFERGGVEIVDGQPTLKLPDPNPGVPETVVTSQNMTPELVFNVTTGVFDYLNSHNDSPKTIDYKNFFSEYVTKWIDGQYIQNQEGTQVVNKNVHLNLEHDKHGAIDDEKATIAVAQLFHDSGWNVSISILDKWGEPSLKQMKSAGAAYFAYQAYNLGFSAVGQVLGLSAVDQVLAKIDIMRQKIEEATGNSKNFVITLPYFGPQGSVHTSVETMDKYSDTLSGYVDLNKIGGSIVYDYISYNSDNKVPSGDGEYSDKSAFQAIDKLYNVEFSDSFENNDLTGWNFFKYSTGLHGSVPDPYISNGRLFITTHDQQQTLLVTGDESWSNYTVEADVKLEQALDDAGKGLYVDFYINNPHSTAEGYNSRDSYAFQLRGRDNTWQLLRVYQYETNTAADILSSGTVPLALGTDYHVKIVNQSNNIKIYFNEVGAAESLLTDVTVTNNQLAGGEIGFGGGDSIISVDNVTVTQN